MRSIDPVHSLAFSIQANPGVYAVLVPRSTRKDAEIWMQRTIPSESRPAPPNRRTSQSPQEMKHLSGTRRRQVRPPDYEVRHALQPELWAKESQVPEKCSEGG